MEHKNFIKLFGVKNSGNLTRPVISMKSEIKLPKASAWLWTSQSEIPSTPRNDTGLLKMNKSIRSVLIGTLQTPIGQLSIKHRNTLEIIKELKEFADYRVYDGLDKVKGLPDSSLVLLNFGALNYIYRYKPYMGADTDKVHNRWSTMAYYCKHKTFTSTRHRYISVEVPNINKKSLKALEHTLGMKSAGISKVMKSENLKSLLEIWQMMSVKHYNDSAFATLSMAEQKNTTFIFQNGLGCTFFNMYDMMSMIKDNVYTSEIHMPKLSDKDARKLLFLYLLRFKNGVPVKAVDRVEKGIMSKATEEGMESKDVDIDDVVNDVDKLIEREDKLTESKPDEIELEDGDSNEGNAQPLEQDAITRESKRITLEELNKKEFDPFETIEKKFADGIINISEKERLTTILEDQYASGIHEKNIITKEDLEIGDTKLPDLPHILNKKYLNDTNGALTKHYIKHIYKKDISNAVYALQKAGIMIEDHSVVEVGNSTGMWEDHTISFRPIGGKKTTKTIRLAKISEDGTIRNNGNNYKEIKQRADKPIRKISPKIVALSSYVGKLFVEKAKYAKDDLGKYINKRLNELLDDSTSHIKLVVNLSAKLIDLNLPVTYSIFARTMTNILYHNIKGEYVKDLELVFDYHYRKRLIDNKQSLDVLEKGGKILIGKSNVGYILMDKDSNIWTDKGKQLPNLEDLLEIDMSKAPIEFSTIKIFKLVVPTALILSFYLGLDNLMHILKVKPDIYDAGKRFPSERGDVIINLQDVTLHIKNPNTLASMILQGFNALKKVSKGVTYHMLNSKDTTLMVLAGMTPRHISEVEGNEMLFIDPITQSILEDMEEPITLAPLIIRASEMLVDDNYKHANNLYDMVIRGYDRIPGILYKALASAAKQQMSDAKHGKAGVEIKKFDVWSDISNDSTMMIMEDLNPIAAIKQEHYITYTGLGGRSIETMVPHTREYHKSDVGVISTDSKDSGKVGVVVGSSADPQFKNIRGVVEYVKDKEVTQYLGISAMTAPFITGDDTKRLNFNDVQNQHVEGSEHYIVLPIRTGYESIIPLVTSDMYAYCAKQEGKVIDVTDHIIVVEYKNKEQVKTKLKEWYTKEEGGMCYKHHIITDLKKGDKFKEGDGIAYDKLFFGADMLNPGGIALKTGMMFRTAFVESYSTYEDSYERTKDGGEILSTENMKIYTLRLDKSDVLTDLPKLGTQLEVNDIITSHGKDLGDGAVESIISDIKATTLHSTVKGEFRRYKVYYNCDPAEASKPLKKLINASDKMLQSEEDDPSINGRIDNTFSDSGIPVADDEIIIKMYVERHLPNSIGDKIIFGNQLKATLGEISNKRVTFNGKPVHGYFSAASADARKVESPDKFGVLAEVLMVGTEQFLKIFDSEK